MNKFIAIEWGYMKLSELLEPLLEIAAKHGNPEIDIGISDDEKHLMISKVVTEGTVTGYQPLKFIAIEWGRMKLSVLIAAIVIATIIGLCLKANFLESVMLGFCASLIASRYFE